LAFIFYALFKVVNRILSALVAFFILVATAIETAPYGSTSGYHRGCVSIAAAVSPPS
jgi:hypothetical protein